MIYIYIYVYKYIYLYIYLYFGTSVNDYINPDAFNRNRVNRINIINNNSIQQRIQLFYS